MPNFDTGVTRGISAARSVAAFADG